jgi:hypothetical protein
MMLQLPQPGVLLPKYFAIVIKFTVWTRDVAHYGTTVNIM